MPYSIYSGGYSAGYSAPYGTAVVDPRIFAISGMSVGNYLLGAAGQGYDWTTNAYTLVVLAYQNANAATFDILYDSRETSPYKGGLAYVSTARKPTAETTAGASLASTRVMVAGDTSKVHRMVWTHSGGNMTCYVNGAAAGSGAFTIQAGGANRQVRLGQSAGGGPCAQYWIAAAAVSSTSLSAGQVATLDAAIVAAYDIVAADLPGCQNLWSVKQSYKSGGATFADSVGGCTLTKQGTLTVNTISSVTWGT